MKTLIAFLFVPFFAFAAVDLDISPIYKALGSGDVETLYKYFDAQVEIAIGKQEDSYSKDKAKEIVKAFFAGNQAKSFQEVHKGASKGSDSHYCIGKLTAGGKPYRVYIYLKVTGEKFTIQELRIESE